MPLPPLLAELIGTLGRETRRQPCGVSCWVAASGTYSAREPAAGLTNDSGADTTGSSIIQPRRRQRELLPAGLWIGALATLTVNRPTNPLAGLRNREDAAEREPGDPVGTRWIGSAQPRGKCIPKRRPFLRRQGGSDRA